MPQLMELELVTTDDFPAASVTVLGNSSAAVTARDHHRRRTLLPRMYPPAESGNASESGSPGSRPGELREREQVWGTTAAARRDQRIRYVEPVGPKR